MKILISRGLDKAPAAVDDVHQVIIVSDEGAPVALSYHADERSIVTSTAGAEDFKEQLKNVASLAKYTNETDTTVVEPTK